MKVSWVTCTYRRMTCVENILAMFLGQDYSDLSELILFNTDADYPFILETPNPRIVVVNNAIDYLTKSPYTNVGAIRRDALTHATGDAYCCADDDDWYAPWYTRQGANGLLRSGRKAWKPKQSLFRTDEGIKMVQNTLEASVIVDMAELRKLGFALHSGKEGLAWYSPLRDAGQLDENEKVWVPSYAFDWSSNPGAIHKQSGNIDALDNFEVHKTRTQDFAFRPLRPSPSLETINAPFYEWFRVHRDGLDYRAVQEYVAEYI